MAWGTNSGSLLAGNELSTNSLAGTWQGVNAAAGDVIFVQIACNNTGTGDGDLSEVTSVVDSVGGNTWTKVKEWTNGQGAAAAGATVAAFYSALTNGLTAAVSTITVNFANTITAKVMVGMQFTKSAGTTVSVAGTVQTEVVDNGDAASLTISGLPSQEYLFIRVIGSETDSAGISALTGSYTPIQQRASGTGGSEKGHISVQGEYRILTGTGDSSDPTLTDTTVDQANIYFALKEAVSATPLTVTVADDIAA